MDPLEDSYSTALAYMSLPLHRRCIVSDSDPPCMHYELQPVGEGFARQVLYINAELCGSDEVNNAAASLFSKVDVI